MKFVELQEQVQKFRHKRAILAYLVEHLDGEFLAHLGGEPKKVLVTDDKNKVPMDAVNELSGEINAWLKAIQVEEDKLLNATINVIPAPPPDEPVPEAKA